MLASAPAPAHAPTPAPAHAPAPTLLALPANVHQAILTLLPPQDAAAAMAAHPSLWEAPDQLALWAESARRQSGQTVHVPTARECFRPRPLAAALGACVAATLLATSVGCVLSLPAAASWPDSVRPADANWPMLGLFLLGPAAAGLAVGIIWAPAVAVESARDALAERLAACRAAAAPYLDAHPGDPPLPPSEERRALASLAGLAHALERAHLGRQLIRAVLRSRPTARTFGLAEQVDASVPPCCALSPAQLDPLLQAAIAARRWRAARGLLLATGARLGAALPRAQQEAGRAARQAVTACRLADLEALLRLGVQPDDRLWAGLAVAVAAADRGTRATEEARPCLQAALRLRLTAALDGRDAVAFGALAAPAKALAAVPRAAVEGALAAAVLADDWQLAAVCVDLGGTLAANAPPGSRAACARAHLDDAGDAAEQAGDPVRVRRLARMARP